MKLKSNYVIKQVLDSNLLIDINSNFDGVIKLNKTSKIICECIQKNMKVSEIVDELSKKYNVDKKVLEKDVNEFINKMLSKGIFIND